MEAKASFKVMKTSEIQKQYETITKIFFSKSVRQKTIPIIDKIAQRERLSADSS